MKQMLTIYNTLSRKKEEFKPILKDFVGMYVCGPTVYGDAHLGHAKSYVSFDVMYRYMKHIGYKVRYVQNITDVGHLTDDADAGEDKILMQSKLEKVEPMEVVENYMNSYYRDMDALNIQRPSIAPRPSGHIPEQIEAIEGLIAKGFAYEANGSVYFNVSQYNENNNYGKLSRRNVDEMLDGMGSRQLDKQSEKKSPVDFALWKRADENHIMRWKSPWGEGFPGWHIECTVMSQKYLGDTFDIHGGGNENMFPHHECEIAQAEANTGKPFAKYWVHHNMVTLNGQKMSKSSGNGVLCHELFSGSHQLLDRAYDPMAVRFLILQSHYRSTLDFSNEALKAVEKGYTRLQSAWSYLDQLKPGEKSKFNVKSVEQACYQAMNDDLNCPKVIANLFECVKQIQLVMDGKASFDESQLNDLRQLFDTFAEEVLGLKRPQVSADSTKMDLSNDVMEVLIDIRNNARERKDFALSDKIRDKLADINVVLKDGKEGTTWEKEN